MILGTEDGQVNICQFDINKWRVLSTHLVGSPITVAAATCQYLAIGRGFRQTNPSPPGHSLQNSVAVWRIVGSDLHVVGSQPLDYELSRTGIAWHRSPYKDAEGHEAFLLAAQTSDGIVRVWKLQEANFKLFRELYPPQRLNYFEGFVFGWLKNGRILVAPQSSYRYASHPLFLDKVLI